MASWSRGSLNKNTLAASSFYSSPPQPPSPSPNPPSCAPSLTSSSSSFHNLTHSLLSASSSSFPQRHRDLVLGLHARRSVPSRPCQCPPFISNAQLEPSVTHPTRNHEPPDCNPHLACSLTTPLPAFSREGESFVARTHLRSKHPAHVKSDEGSMANERGGGGRHAGKSRQSAGEHRAHPDSETRRKKGRAEGAGEA